METTKHKLPEEANIFFNNLSEFLDINMVYFGSIQRGDYFPGDSDIDVDIFTDNENSTIVKMQEFLHKSRNKFKKIVWRIRHSNRLVSGYKVFYKHPSGKFSAEFSIYNNKFKEDVLAVHQVKMSLPFYVTYMLIFLKMLYYNFGIMNNSTFKYIKNKLLSVCIGLPAEEFVILDSK